MHQATLVLLVLREREETGVNQDRGVCRGRSGHKVRQEKQVTTETLGPPELPAFPDQQDHLEIPYECSTKCVVWLIPYECVQVCVEGFIPYECVDVCS